MTMGHRVVITSMGFVSALGSEPAEVLDNMRHDRVTFTRPSFDPATAVCPVHDFHVKTYTGRFKEARYLNRGVKFAVAAAVSAVNRSGLSQAECDEAGLFLGSGPNMDMGREFPNITEGEIHEDGLSALFLLRFLSNTAASAVSKIAGIHGENLSVGTACSASLMAIGEAFRKVRDGYLDLAFAGGGDSRLSQVGQLAYRKAQALWHKDGDPKTGYAPFDRDRNGFVAGEGGACVLLERLDHALERKAPILAEICGYGASMDGQSMTAPAPDGVFAEKALRKALNEAGLAPSDVDLVSAHGTGTVLNDRMEADMLRRVFGENQPGITALKSWVGHLASACGAVELALCLCFLKEKIFPGIRNLHDPLAPDLNFLTGLVPMAPRSLVLENFGFGGQNCALVVKPWA